MNRVLEMSVGQFAIVATVVMAIFFFVGDVIKAFRRRAANKASRTTAK
ncbi:MAG: hypothetical protein Q7S28_00850 [bacterium]|nr:hypothetical protein [bacterium]